ncbi:hypothetical protein TNCV_2234261 [Trichonephila clavipes]|nr:hypothetical protein TNCV_2234261 [Trichonephila clavipes]
MIVLEVLLLTHIFILIIYTPARLLNQLTVNLPVPIDIDFSEIVLESYWNRWSLSILAWLPSEHSSSSARPSQWRLTPRRSCPVVRRKRATASSLSKCLGIGPTVVRGSRGFPRLLIFWVKVVHLSMCGDIMSFALLKGQGDFQ